MNPALKLTEEIAADIKARIQSLDLKTINKINKARQVNGTFDVIISTEVKDRAGETVMQDGWELENYKNNPIVLWGHDYYGLPIGVCTETYITEYRGTKALGAKGVFLPADINPLAQQVRRLYDFGIKQGGGVGCTTSVGFIPRQRDESDSSIITRSELLEFSFVPVPANQGVGAGGRAITFEEAKALDLDIHGMTAKGMNFVETKDLEDVDEDDAEDSEGDEGEEGESEDTPVVEPDAVDNAEAVPDPREPQKALVKALSTESERHVDETDKAIEEFAGKVAGLTAGSTDAETTVRESIKDLRSDISDEHTTHRSNTIACFRAFTPTDTKKALDRNKHLKALRTENAEQEARDIKTLEEFEERCLKSVQAGQIGELEDHVESLTGKMEASQRPHKKTLGKIAKTMCREALGEDEVADEKTIEIVKEHLAPYVDAKNLAAVSIKVGARISAATKAKLGEAHEHLKAALVVVEALHGALENDDGEEGRSDGDGKSTPSPAPRKQRSRPTEDTSRNDELDSHLFTRDILRGITTAAQEGLKTLKEKARK